MAENTSRLYNVGNHSDKYNIVRDFDKVQGTTHPTDLSYQIRRDIGVRYITVENSSPYPIGVAIMPYMSGETPRINFILERGEIRHLGINSHGGPPQFIWLLDVNTKLPVGESTMTQRNSNSFVIRQGLNKYFIQLFQRPSYRAAF